MRVWRDGVELDVGPRQQAYLLAVLLANAGKPTSMSALVDLVWADDVPVSAANILQKYVGALRRLLEPTLPARATGSHLRRHGSGYLFTADPARLDVALFQELVGAAQVAAAEKRPDAALDLYVRALGLWRGSAGEGLAHGPTGMSIFASLDAEFLEVCVAAADLAVACGQPGRVLHALRLAARMAPLHEAVHASLANALADAGQPAEALSLLRTVRSRLAEELGIDPGPALVAAYRRVLEKAPDPRPSASASVSGHLIGRAEDLAKLRRTVEAALGGATGLGLVEGEPGVGKTRLLEEIAAEAERRGALVAWGRCLEGDVAPSMWPWVQAVGAVVDALPPAARQQVRGNELGPLLGLSAAAAPLPPGGGRFHLFEQAVAIVGQVSLRRPVVLLVDDLQWADAASLDLFSHLIARQPSGTAVIAAFRASAPTPGPDLSRVLSAASRLPVHRRVRLGPLGVSEVAELVRRETGQHPSSRVTQQIVARTGGNPFFVRELSRQLAAEAVCTEVPATVQDVVRGRVAALADEAQSLLRIAALIGREFEIPLLAGSAGLDVATCLGLLERLEGLALIEPAPGNPYSYRFTHDLVRESVAGAVSPPHAARLHLRIGDVLEPAVAQDETMVERLAYHLWSAGPLAEPGRTVAMLIRAGRCAAAKGACDAAARHVKRASRLARTAGLAELELSALALLTAVDGMREGYYGAAQQPLERAEELARHLGRERDAADFLFSRWVAHAQGIELDRAGRLAARLLSSGEASQDPIIQAYGRYAWGIHQWEIGNIGAAYRYLSRTDSTVRDVLADGADDQLRRDLRMLGPVMLALMTALHGDVTAARALLDTIESAIGDEPYVITVWAAFTVTVAALAGDPAWALRVARRGIAVDRDFSFGYFGGYQRLAQCWGRAVTGQDPTGAALEAEGIISAVLAEPPRSGLATWCGLLGEMWLAGDKLDEAAAALDRADSLLDTHGERYAEGLLLLLRARVMNARGEPVASVRAVAERARALSVEREAHLFAQRAEELLAALADR
ncbi:ATP-binding protein [Asanoa iriomotensis]|uniref:ATP-binding protein n=1 Tax=Asanoa iriomotensis TaxID=234613 RepID=UPI001EF270D7|nr:BTAD domain-containing putative transcriptional regulator [Asanoa iriomotensis]